MNAAERTDFINACYSMLRYEEHDDDVFALDLHQMSDDELLAFYILLRSRPSRMHC
jgi:hypothetical protein